MDSSWYVCGVRGEWGEGRGGSGGGGGGISEPDPFLRRFGFKIRRGQIITVKLSLQLAAGSQLTSSYCWPCLAWLSTLCGSIHLLFPW